MRTPFCRKLSCVAWGLVKSLHNVSLRISSHLGGFDVRLGIKPVVKNIPSASLYDAWIALIIILVKGLSCPFYSSPIDIWELTTSKAAPNVLLLFFFFSLSFYQLLTTSTHCFLCFLQGHTKEIHSLRRLIVLQLTRGNYYHIPPPKGKESLYIKGYRVLQEFFRNKY